MHLKSVCIMAAALAVSTLTAGPASTASSSEVSVRLSAATSVVESPLAALDARYCMWAWSNFCTLTGVCPGVMLLFR